MQITFKNKRVVSYYGRNGFGKQIGMELLPIGDPTPEQVVTISPINSKKMVGNCMIDLPVQDIPELILELQRIYVVANAPKK